MCTFTTHTDTALCETVEMKGERKSRGSKRGEQERWGRRTTACEDVGVGGVNNDGPKIVSVGLKRVHFLQSVVVEHTHQHVVL